MNKINSDSNKELEFCRQASLCIESIEIEEEGIERRIYGIVSYIYIKRFWRLMKEVENKHSNENELTEIELTITCLNEYMRIRLDEINWNHSIKLEHLVQLYINKNRCVLVFPKHLE